MHSTNTILTYVTQKVFDGINSKKPKCTVIVTLDISKTFDAVPTVTNKIYDIEMHNNTKRWLANFLSGRTAQVDFKGQKSSHRNLKNGIPQGAVLSPMFNLYGHDMAPPPIPQINIVSYADDITITNQHRNADTATQQLQPYIDVLGQWFNNNRLKIASAKSTATLLQDRKGT